PGRAHDGVRVGPVFVSADALGDAAPRDLAATGARGERIPRAPVRPERVGLREAGAALERLAVAARRPGDAERVRGVEATPRDGPVLTGRRAVAQVEDLPLPRGRAARQLRAGRAAASQIARRLRLVRRR